MAVAKPKGRKTCQVKLKVDRRWVRFPGVKDRGTSESIGRRIARLLHARTHHESVPSEVLAWLQNLPTRMPRLYARLVKHGLADATMIGRRPLSELLVGKIKPKPGFAEQAKCYNRNGNSLAQAERKVRVRHPTLYTVLPDEGGYFQSLLADGNTAEHVLQMTSRIETVLNSTSGKILMPSASNSGCTPSARPVTTSASPRPTITSKRCGPSPSGVGRGSSETAKRTPSKRWS